MEIINDSGIGKSYPELDITTKWAALSSSALYGNDEEGNLDDILCKGLWFIRFSWEKGGGGIVDRYVCDRWLPCSVYVE